MRWLSRSVDEAMLWYSCVNFESFIVLGRKRDEKLSINPTGSGTASPTGDHPPFKSLIFPTMVTQISELTIFGHPFFRTRWAGFVASLSCPIVRPSQRYAPKSGQRPREPDPRHRGRKGARCDLSNPSERSAECDTRQFIHPLRLFSAPRPPIGPHRTSRPLFGIE